ncbi:DUF6075 family protein [Tyzzerella sp. OttesenSCG-928-J15]|nr:DUF6075 family protein [Tyzzerella sp. OttesenSCG-928-J15]
MMSAMPAGSLCVPLAGDAWQTRRKIQSQKSWADSTLKWNQPILLLLKQIKMKRGLHMIFLDKKHQQFFEDCISRSNTHSDPYHLALFYTLGLTDETRRHIAGLYNFKEKGIEFDGLTKGWQTSTSIRVTRLAFNLFNGWNGDDGIDRPEFYTPYELFCDGLASYMFEAVKLRYPEYFPKQQRRVQHER